jgi:hypothetical protein
MYRQILDILADTQGEGGYIVHKFIDMRFGTNHEKYCAEPRGTFINATQY